MKEEVTRILRAQEFIPTKKNFGPAAQGEAELDFIPRRPRYSFDTQSTITKLKLSLGNGNKGSNGLPHKEGAEDSFALSLSESSNTSDSPLLDDSSSDGSDSNNGKASKKRKKHHKESKKSSKHKKKHRKHKTKHHKKQKRSSSERDAQVD